MTGRHNDGRFRFSRFPLVLPHGQAQRMLDRNTSALILARDLTDDAYEVHDADVIRLNQRNTRRGREDLQTDPALFVIEITPVSAAGLLELDVDTMISAGFENDEDFYRDWLRRHGTVVIGLQVKVYAFRIAEEALYLHQKVHLGYTRNPAEAVHGEPQVIDRDQLELYSTDARARYDAEHADEVARREAKVLATQLREARMKAALTGVDVTAEIAEIRESLERIQSKVGAAA